MQYCAVSIRLEGGDALMLVLMFSVTATLILLFSIFVCPDTLNFKNISLTLSIFQVMRLCKEFLPMVICSYNSVLLFLTSSMSSAQILKDLNIYIKITPYIKVWRHPTKPGEPLDSDSRYSKL